MLLFSDYSVLVKLGANIHARDHSGKKPKDVVRDTVAADVQSKLFDTCLFLSLEKLQAFKIIAQKNVYFTNITVSFILENFFFCLKLTHHS